MSLGVEPAVEGAVARALSVLEFLALAGEPVRLSTIALGLSMQKSTVHRILASLASCGYVEQVRETSCYTATLKLWELGASILHQHPVKRASAGFLQELHRSTGETVSLTILSGDDVLYLEKMLSPRAIRFNTHVGSRVPAALTAGGKAMLAHLPDARARLKRTASRIKGPARFNIDVVMRELEEVRSRGYAISSYSPGVTSVGAPLLSRSGNPEAAISVSAPTDRVSTQKRKAIIEGVLNTCANIAERVGL